MTSSIAPKGITIVLLCLFFFACNDDNSDVNTNDNLKTLVDIQSLDDFEKEIEEGISLFFFHATWCSICADQRPAIEALPQEDELKEMFFGEVDYEQVQEVVTATGVQGFPTIVIFKDGEEQERLTGSGHSVDKLKNILLELE
jgi:thioredoxin 1